MLACRALLATALSFTALSVAAPAAGQAQQTPANAHRFLQNTLPLVRVASVKFEGGYWRSVPDYSIARYEQNAGDRCVGDVVNASGYNWKIVYGALTSVAQDGSSVTFVHPVQGVKWKETLKMDSEALAARVAYAMTFLKEACDPNAGLGF